ncbi:MAG TPA: tetratricopeptide repeat protein, partial [Ktedonobacteraceae bacterium]
MSFVVITNFAGMSGGHGAFGLMVQDAYDNVYTTALLKRYGTAANADESRWLIAVDFGDQTEINRWQQDWYANKAQVNTLIQQVDGNRVWPAEEDQPLADMQSHWNTYTSIDPQIRALAENTANPNRIHDAQAVSTGQSNENFYAFTTALDRLSTVSRDHYTTTYTITNATLMYFIPLSILLFLLIGLLAVWGIARRLKDF